VVLPPLRRGALVQVYDRIPRDAYLALVDEARRLGLDVVGHRPHAVSAIDAAAHQKSLDHARFLLHESFAGSAELRAQAGTAAWREDRRRMLDEHDPAMAAAVFEAMARARAGAQLDGRGEDPLEVRQDPGRLLTLTSIKEIKSTYKHEAHEGHEDDMSLARGIPVSARSHPLNVFVAFVTFVFVRLY